MTTLYEDLFNGTIGHFYRLEIQNPKNRDAIVIEEIHAPYGRTPVLSVRRIISNESNFITEKTKGIINFTDLKQMKRVSDEEEKEIESKLEKISSENKANLSAKREEQTPIKERSYLGKLLDIARATSNND